MKFFNYVFFIIAFVASCSKPLSNTDFNLQGEWKIKKSDMTGMGLITDTIIFSENNFEVKGTNVSDVMIDGVLTHKYFTEGKYRSDSIYIYFNEGDKEFPKKVKYKFSGDTLIFAFFESTLDFYENGSLAPQYLLRDTGK